MERITNAGVNLENIGRICTECMKQKLKEFQKANKGFEVRRGDFIKTKFKDRGITDGELMWVRVTSVKDGIISGRLDNIPLFLKSVKLGDKVTVKKSQICELIKKSQVW